MSAAVAVLALLAANHFVVSAGFWRFIAQSKAHLVAQYDPVLRQMPNNLAPPPWAQGGTVLVGASTVGASLPTERTEALLGRPAWTVWVSGARPPEFLALAPYILRVRPRHVMLGLEVRHAGLGGNTPFSERNRRAYVGWGNPAWSYHRRQTDQRLPAIERVALFRLAGVLRRLGGGYVQGPLLKRRVPETSAWQRMENRYNAEHARLALADYRANPTLDRYDAYLWAIGMTDEGGRVFWHQMRAIPPDTAGAGDNVRALLDVTAYFRAHGCTVSWFLFPENPMTAIVPGPDGGPLAPPELVPHAQRVFADLARREQVPFLDLVHLAGADGYLDYAHLAPPEAARLGAELGAFLERVDGRVAEATGEAAS